MSRSYIDDKKALYAWAEENRVLSDDKGYFSVTIQRVLDEHYEMQQSIIALVEYLNDFDPFNVDVLEAEELLERIQKEYKT